MYRIILTAIDVFVAKLVLQFEQLYLQAEQASNHYRQLYEAGAAQVRLHIYTYTYGRAWIWKSVISNVCVPESPHIHIRFHLAIQIDELTETCKQLEQHR
jgi:hypothetical protein